MTPAGLSEPEGESSSQAETTEPGPPSQARSSRVVSRSCYSCGAKKIRCDKREPCTACTRAGRSCEYPPVGPRARRPKKTIIADMSSRIADLEKMVVNARSGKTSQSAASITVPQNIAGEHKDAGNRSRQDIIVQKGSSSQYFNEIMLSRAIKEEHNIESILTPQAESTGPPAPSLFNAMGILSSPSAATSPANLHPPSHVAVRLWNIYIDNVEACAGLKLLHQPTDEVRVYSVISSPSTASLEDLSLSFAVYFASTVALDPAEAELLFGHDKNTACLQFKLGLEQSFAYGDFLDQPTISGLHALAIYLAALRVLNRGKGIWILNGLAVRIAQSLGLHRDGKRLGLSPFQTEIRRRLWWHLLVRDSRAGEDYGLENIHSPFTDVDLPANVNDLDLRPEMKEPPVPRTGWTAMTFPLITIEMSKTMQKLAAMAASASPSSPPSEDVRAEIMRDLRARAERRTVHCNPVIPQQRLAIVCTSFILTKLDFITRLQWILLRQRAGLHSDFATEENLAEALGLLQPRLYEGDGLLKQFAWTRHAYPQYHVIMYVLLHLCVRPEGPSIDRAWRSVDQFLEDEMQCQPAITFGSKLAVLAVLRAKAVTLRDKLQGRRPAGGNRDGGDHESGVASMEGPSESETLSASIRGNVGNEYGFDANGEDWPDWATLVQDFHLDTSDVFMQ